ncbi:type II secretion system protein [Kamptonema cortianum]|nr:type II secretion system protein [Geitlerinema splendidum]MDK3155208.1 type II secretion system protein [Kamptonema cortianum]
MKRAFTLIELLVVLAIIAVLAAVVFPVFVSAKGAVHQMGAGRMAGQYFTATTLYASDHDDHFPLAMYWTGTELMTWFGQQVGETEFDESKGIVSPYMKGKLGSDNALVADPYLGTPTGIGYNWGVIGSDFHLKGDYSDFPNCKGAATMSQLENPSRTAVFATSAYYSPTWVPDGTGRKMQFNFFDPIEAWPDGIPNIDFRHLGTSKLDDATRSLITTGNAMISFADGNVRQAKQKEIKSEWFWRGPSQQQ